VGNGPVTFIDPLGLFPEDVIGGDDPSQYIDDPDDSDGSEAASMVLDFVPVVSEIKGLIEMVSGKDLLTGECLGKGRYLVLLGPLSKVKNAAKIGKIVRSSYQKKKFLKQLALDRKNPKWMNQWLKKGKVPPGYQVEHVKPLSIGGADKPSNMKLRDIDMHKTHHKYYHPWRD
jgi:hypothetical protein